MPEARVTLPLVKVDGTELDSEVIRDVIDIRIEKTLHVPARFTVRLRGLDYELDGTFKIGAAVELGFTAGGTETSVLKGEITDVTLDADTSSVPEFVVGGMDAGHRLAHTTKLRTFTEMSYSDIVRTVAGDYALSPQCESSTVVIPYVLQKSSDYAFVDELALAAGFEWWVDDTKLFFRKQPEWADSGTLTYGDDLRRFRARYSAADRAQDVTVQSWDSEAQAALSATESRGFSNPDAKVVGAEVSMPATRRRQANGTGTGFGGPRINASSGALVQAEAKAIAESIVNRMAAAEFVARGETYDRPQLAPGKSVEIDGLGDSLNGKYYLTKVVHVWAAGKGLLTKFESGARDPAGLVDLLGAHESGLSTWGERGLLVGKVDNIQDPDKLGRVRVKFPTLSDTDTSHWARLVVDGAGQDRGTLAMPEIDDEVLVGFEQGDPRRPFVLGSVWNKKAKPPTEALVENEKVKTRVIKSRTGHIITLSDGDSPADKFILLQASDGKTKLLLSEEKIELFANNKSIEIKTAQADVLLKDNGDLVLKGNNVTIEAAQKLVLKSGTDLEAKAGTNGKIEAAIKLDLKASAQAMLDGGGQLAVKGAMVQIN